MDTEEPSAQEFLETSDLSVEEVARTNLSVPRQIKSIQNGFLFHVPLNMALPGVGGAVSWLRRYGYRLVSPAWRKAVLTRYLKNRPLRLTLLVSRTGAAAPAAGHQSARITLDGDLLVGLSRCHGNTASAADTGDPGGLDGVAGSVGDGLLRAVLELGFVEPLQVPHAGRREYRGD
jgi:hypothetical protein